MIRRTNSIVLFVVLISSSAIAQPKCDELTESQIGYVHSHYPGYRILSMSDLSQDDQTIWNKSKRASECPAIAKGRFTGQNHGDVAIALLKGNGIHLSEKIILLTDGKSGYSSRSVWADKGIYVIYRLPPGKYEDMNGKKRTYRLDSVGIEVLESTSLIANLEHNKLEVLRTTD